MSEHTFIIKIDTGQSPYSPHKGYKHLDTDIKDWLNDVFTDCEIGYKVKSVHLLPITENENAI